MDYIIENGGIDTEEDYPYLAHDDKCMCAPEITMSKYLLHSFIAVTLTDGMPQCRV